MKIVLKGWGVQSDKGVSISRREVPVIIDKVVWDQTEAYEWMPSCGIWILLGYDSHWRIINRSMTGLTPCFKIINLATCIA